MANDGGPIHPDYKKYEYEEYDQNKTRYEAVGGMTLRDYFAAKAMQGLCANSSVDYEHKDAAEYAYNLADAMLTARDQAGKGENPNG